jgi:hypothetical protein
MKMMTGGAPAAAARANHATASSIVAQQCSSTPSIPIIAVRRQLNYSVNFEGCRACTKRDRVYPECYKVYYRYNKQDRLRRNAIHASQLSEWAKTHQSLAGGSPRATASTKMSSSTTRTLVPSRL